MKIAFYKAFQGKATKLDKAIAILTVGKYSHVELVFSDGLCFSVSPRDKGTRFKKINLDNGAWEVIDIPMLDKTEGVIRSISESLVGCKYDYIGALFSISPVCIQKDKRYFCSELAANLLHQCIYYQSLNDGCKYSPNKLYKEIKELKNV
jgi:hypothetical protein